MSWLPEVSEKIRTLEMKYPEAKIWECVHESTRQSCYMPSHWFQWNFASLKGLPQNSNRQTGFRFWFFPGEDRPTPGFSRFRRGNRFKMGKMYEALTAMQQNLRGGQCLVTVGDRQLWNVM